MGLKLTTTVKQDQSVSRGLVVGGGFVLAQIIMLLVWGWGLPPEIPLFYSLTAGAAQLAAKNWYFILPIMGVGFYLAALVMVKLARGFTAALAQIIVWLTNIGLLMIAIAMAHILLLVY